MEKEILGLISIAMSVVGYLFYIRSVFKKRTRPHVFSWGVWGLLMCLVCFAQLSKGAGPGAWVTGFSGLMCFVIAAAALKQGEKNITRGDKIALTGALITIPIWYLTHDPLWVVVLATAIDGMAYYPTMRKSYIRPHEEYYPTYALDIVKWIVALFALENYSFVTLLYPLFLLCANGGLVVMVLVRRRKKV